MLWSTLHSKIGKQPLAFTQHNHVYAVLENPATKRLENIQLDLKYDAQGRPYFVRREQNDL